MRHYGHDLEDRPGRRQPAGRAMIPKPDPSTWDKPLAPITILVGRNGSGKTQWAAEWVRHLHFREHPTDGMHPHAQVLYARSLVSMAGVHLIIETHSDHLIGELGLMVARGELPADSVLVIGFEHGPKYLAWFDDDGVLHGLPSGFMAP